MQTRNDDRTTSALHPIRTPHKRTHTHTPHSPAPYRMPPVISVDSSVPSTENPMIVNSEPKYSFLRREKPACGGGAVAEAGRVVELQ